MLLAFRFQTDGLKSWYVYALLMKVFLWDFEIFKVE